MPLRRLLPVVAGVELFDSVTITGVEVSLYKLQIAKFKDEHARKGRLRI